MITLYIFSYEGCISYLVLKSNLVQPFIIRIIIKPNDSFACLRL